MRGETKRKKGDGRLNESIRRRRKLEKTRGRKELEKDGKEPLNGPLRQQHVEECVHHDRSTVCLFAYAQSVIVNTLQVYYYHKKDYD